MTTKILYTRKKKPTIKNKINTKLSRQQICGRDSRGWCTWTEFSQRQKNQSVWKLPALSSAVINRGPSVVMLKRSLGKNDDNDNKVTLPEGGRKLAVDRLGGRINHINNRSSQMTTRQVLYFKRYAEVFIFLLFICHFEPSKLFVRIKNVNFKWQWRI